MTIKELPESERPYEKLQIYGAEKLSNAELLAIIIKTGNKDETSLDLACIILNLNKKNNNLRDVLNSSIEEFMTVKGIGKAKAIQLVAVSEIAKKGIFMLFQNPLEIAGVTNAEMLRLALSERGIHKSIFEFNKELNEVLKKVGLPKEFLHRGINERMSGGERKKNEMLHLYILKPKLIILDELDSGLDIDSLKSITKNLKEYKKENNCSIIIITHHLNILEGLKPDKVHIINDGKIAVSGDYNLAKKIEKEGFSGAFNINAGEENE